MPYPAGGSGTQIQFNNAGWLDGIAGSAVIAATGEIALNSYSITTTALVLNPFTNSLICPLNIPKFLNLDSTNTNLLLGFNAGNGITGSANIGIGANSLNVNSGRRNIAIGSGALGHVSSASDNLFIGFGAGSNIGTGEGSVGIGSYSLGNINSGSRNTAVGFNSGNNFNSNVSNDGVFIGYGCNVQDDIDNVIYIGSGVTGVTANQVILGNESITSTILRGTISGGNFDYITATSIKITDGAALGKILMSDAVGNGSWQYASATAWTFSSNPDNHLFPSAYADTKIGIGTDDPSFLLQVGLETITPISDAALGVYGKGSFLTETETINNITSGSATQNNGAYSFIANGADFSFDIYAYKTSSDSAIFYSAIPLNIIFTDDNSFNTFRINLTWTAVAGAEGYRIIVVKDIANGYIGNYYIDVLTNVLNYDGVATLGKEVAPSSPYHLRSLEAIGSAYVGGKLFLNKPLSLKNYDSNSNFPAEMDAERTIATTDSFSVIDEDGKQITLGHTLGSSFLSYWDGIQYLPIATCDGPHFYGKVRLWNKTYEIVPDNAGHIGEIWCDRPNVKYKGTLETKDIYRTPYNDNFAMEGWTYGNFVGGTYSDNTLLNYGSAIPGDPTTLGINLTNENTWTGIQTFASPIKITSGTLLGSPEAGAVEWDGVNLFVTQTSGLTRKTVAYTGDSATVHNILSATHSDSTASSPILGSLIYSDATPKWAQLSGNVTATKKFLSQTGTGIISAVPGWDTVSKTDVGLGSVDDIQQLPLSYLDLDTTLSNDSDTKVSSQKAVKTYIDGIIAAANALVYKGVIDCSGNPNYPAADAGWVYVASVAGKIGGVAGIVVDLGDLILCNTDGTVSGDQATVGAFWNIVEKNVVGAVSGPASATDTAIVIFDGATGKIIKNSAVTIDGSGNVITPGSVGNTGARILKGWFTDLEVTNAIAGSINGTANISTTATITEDIATATPVYPTWVTANTGNLPVKTTSTKLSFVPSTGVLTGAGFSGPLAGVASGNVSDVTDATLTRSGTGPYTLGLALGNANTWTAAQVISNNLTVDTNSLFVDSVNHRVGIGTATPSGKLQVNSGAATDIGVIVKGVAGQTANLLQLRDSTDIVHSYFDNNANLSIGTPSSIGALTQTGTGLSDLTLGGTYSNAFTQTLRIKITTAGTPDMFDWSIDGGVTWVATGVSIVAGPMALNYTGATVTFSATTGHTLNDYWQASLTAPVGYNSATNSLNIGVNPVVRAFGLNNTAIGIGAMGEGKNTGYYNTANGVQSLYSNTTGANNTANGMFSLISNTTGANNTANGTYSLYSNTTGSYNTTNGYQSLYSNTTGSANTANGHYAGRYIADGVTGRTTGDYGLYLGYNTKASADGTTNETVIGYNATGNGSNSVTLGNTSVTKMVLNGNVGVGVQAPSAALHLKAGTGTAATAPLKLTAGTNLTTPEAGAVEYDGSHLYFTALGGGTRYQLDQQPGVQTPWLSAINAAGYTLNGNSTASGALTLDSTSSATKGFVLINPTGGNVGVGTTAPTANLQVAQGTTGVGTVSTTATLTTVTGVGTQFTNTFKVGNTITVNAETRTIATIVSDTSLTTDAWTSSNAGLAYTLTGGTRFSVLGNGNVGIGIASPTHLLDVNGTTQTTAFTVIGTTTFHTSDIVSGTVTIGPGGSNAGSSIKTSGTAYDTIGIPGYNTYLGPTTLQLFSTTLFVADATTGGGLILKGSNNAAARTASSFFQINSRGNTSTTNGLVVNNFAGTTNFLVRDDGNVGIGTTTPSTKLHIVGTDVQTSGTGAVGLSITPTYNQASGTAANTDLLINRTETAVGSGAQLLIDAQVGGVSRFSIDNLGGITHYRTITAGGTTGNQTINKPSGTVNIAAAGTTVTVTNSLVTTSSIIYAVIRTNDATATIKNVVPAAGSFVINLGASATAEVSIGFLVSN